jgi:tripartite-type tricarboxylate transporter receptor subunit TctC
MKKLLLTLLLLPMIVFAWEPSKPVTAVIGNAPGAGNEIAFRKLTGIISKTSKVSYVVENKPGADSVIAMNYMTTASADGHTLAVINHMSTYVTNDIWEKNVKKFEYNSFTDVLTIGKSPLVLVANIKSKINTPLEFARLVTTTKQPVFIAIGSGAHKMAFEYTMFKTQGNKELVKTIQFHGPAQALMSVVSDSGGTEFGIMPIAVAKSLIDAGRVKAIGITGDRKLTQMPFVPLLKEIAPGINVYAAWAIVLPPDTPKDILDYYTYTFATAIRTAEYREWCDENLVFVEERELTHTGLRKHAEELRANFLPLAKLINLNE